MNRLRLIGYGPSVYTRAVRLALIERERPHDWTEADPFTPEGRAALAGLHPFARVPVLVDGAVTIYETRAILAYLFAEAPALTPLASAREAQVQGIVDAYGYWPLVRQVFAHGVFRDGDPGEVAAGLDAAGPVLDALDTIAAEGAALGPDRIGPADLHLAPMIDAFQAHPDGAEMLAARPALAAWHARIAARPSMKATRWTGIAA